MFNLVGLVALLSDGGLRIFDIHLSYIINSILLYGSNITTKAGQFSILPFLFILSLTQSKPIPMGAENFKSLLDFTLC